MPHPENPLGVHDGPRRQLRAERVPILLHGRDAMAEVPIVPADTTGPLREGLQRRRDAAITGRCTCGATRAATTRRQRRRMAQPGQLIPVRFNHRRDCPAHAELLAPLLAAWQAGNTDQEVTRGA